MWKTPRNIYQKHQMLILTFYSYKFINSLFSLYTKKRKKNLCISKKGDISGETKKERKKSSKNTDQNSVFLSIRFFLFQQNWRENGRIVIESVCLQRNNGEISQRRLIWFWKDSEETFFSISFVAIFSFYLNPLEKD